MARIDLTNYYNPDVGKVTILPSTIMNYYLWNSPNEPSWSDVAANRDGEKWRTGDNLFRKPVTLDTSEHMTTGPGRFVSVADFQFFKDFFDSKHGLPAGTYTINGKNGSEKLPTSIIEQLVGQENNPLGIPTTTSILSTAISQYKLPGGSDFFSRMFVFGSEAYEVPIENIQKDLVLVVNEDGTEEIRGLKIIPKEDNFDFESSSGIAQLVNPSLEAELDPMDTGRKVPIKYEGDVEALTITEVDFRALEAAKAKIQPTIDTVKDYGKAAISLKNDIMSKSSFYKSWSRPVADKAAEEVAKKLIEELLDPDNVILEFGESPIIIDLEGNGVETLGLKSGVRFDHDKNGFAEKTGWAGKDDGLLVMDLNKNKTIDNGGELFGSNMLLADGKTHANTGFEALAQYDSNKNGKIDAGDEGWSDLQVWQDADADGVSDEGELKTLDEIGITSINLDYAETGETDINGNLHKQSSSATWKDSKTTDAVDVWFRTEGFENPPVSKFTHTAEIDELPEVIAFGRIHHLRDAMMQDKDLLEKMKEYSADPSEDNLEELIYQWADVNQIDPDGPKHVDMRKLAVLEDLLDVTVLNKDGHDWSKNFAQNVEEDFNRFADYVAANIEMQGMFKEALGSKMITNDANGNIIADWLSVNLYIDKLLVDKDAEKASDFTEVATKALTYSSEQADWIVNSAQKMTSAMFHYGEVADLKKLAELDGTVGDDGNNHLKAGSDHNILLEGAVLFGGDGNDKLKGGKDNDVLVGGAGNDKLEGKGGSDLYVFEKDFGKDKIDSDDDDDGSDVIRFAEYLQTDLNFVRSSDNLVITTKEGDNALKVEDFFEDGKDGASIDSIVFADYSFLDKNAITDLAETVEVGCGIKATDGHGCFKYAEKPSAPAMHSSPALDEAAMEIVG